MTHLVIGSAGQVGSAILTILSSKYSTVGIDLGDRISQTFDVLHICFPYNEVFEFSLTNYIKQYLKPCGLVIIHSTVPLGISFKYGAVHSPVRGVHPDLVKGIHTFDKYFGGLQAEKAAKIFIDLGINCITTDKSSNTEAMKLWDTTYYGWNIVFEKAVKSYCLDHNLDFDLVYTNSNLDYNYGYTKLGKSYVQRPVLQDYPGKIGGHCVIPNTKLLGGDIANFILAKNERY